MSEGFSNSVVGGQSTLIRQAIESANYIAGTSGWEITRAGAAEFNNAVIRGSLVAGGGLVLLNNGGLAIKSGNDDYEINSNAGFLARLIPDDGTIYELSDTGFFWRGPTPTVSGGHTIQHIGTMFASTIGATNGLQLETRLTNMSWGSNLPGLISLRSDSFDGVTHSSANLIAEDVHLTAATGGTVDHGDATFVDIPHRLTSTQTGMDYPAAQVFTASLTVTSATAALISVTYPAPFPSGATLFGHVNNQNPAGAATFWTGRWIPVDNTKCNIQVINMTNTAGTITSTFNISVFIVPS